MKVKCPKCGKEVPFADNPFRPFCSERCKLLDLGDWLSGSYSVEGEHEQKADATPESVDEEDS